MVLVLIYVFPVVGKIQSDTTKEKQKKVLKFIKENLYKQYANSKELLAESLGNFQKSYIYQWQN